jgi:putative membrane protein
MATAWTDNPVIAAALMLVLLAYCAGLTRCARLPGQPAFTGRWHIAAFMAGLVVASLALLSPLDALGARLFSAHMAQHLLLIIVAAPLLAASEAHLVIAAALPARLRPALLKEWTRLPEAGWWSAVAFAISIWFWHIPAAHDWAAENSMVHAVEQLGLLVLATGFWRVVMTAGQRRISRGAAAVIVSLVSLQGALLSAIIMFAPHQLCRAYADNPLSDQVLAGLLMCIPASFAYLVSTVWALSRLFKGAESNAG